MLYDHVIQLSVVQLHSRRLDSFLHKYKVRANLSNLKCDKTLLNLPELKETNLTLNLKDKERT